MDLEVVELDADAVNTVELEAVAVVVEIDKK